jgi:alpha-ribazole phosphatase
MTAVVVTFLRHGAVAGRANVFRGVTDDALSVSGRAEMHAALDAMSGDFARIVSSPLARCSAFARDLAARLERPLAIDEALAEMRFGTWENLSEAEIRLRDGDAIDRFRTDPSAVTPAGGEPFAAFEARVGRGIEALVAAPGPVLAITHAGVIRVAIAHALGLAPPAIARIALGSAAWARLSYLRGQPPVLLELRSNC